MHKKTLKTGVENLRILKIAAIFAGAVLGAGFASGQEIWAFFTRFGEVSLVGVIISGLLIMFFGGEICSGAFKRGSTDYISYLKSLFITPLAKIVYIITQLFLVMSFAIMISGSGELLNEQFAISKILGELFTILICFWCFYNNVSGLAKLNLILTPIMSAGIIITSVISIFKAEEVFFNLNSLKDNYLISATLYVSYNILSSAAVLAVSSKIAKNKREAYLGGVFGGGVLLVIMLVCSLCLIKSESIVKGAAFPMLEAAKRAGSIFGYIYPPVIYMAMITTAVSSGFCVLEVLKRFKMDNKVASFVLCTAIIPLSMIEFSSLIKNCYALFGFLGFLLIFGIILNKVKTKK